MYIRIAGNFWGTIIIFVFSQFVVFIFVVAACTAGKVASFVGKIFVVQYSTTKTTDILPPRPLYVGIIIYAW